MKQYPFLSTKAVHSEDMITDEYPASIIMGALTIDQKKYLQRVPELSFDFSSLTSDTEWCHIPVTAKAPWHLRTTIGRRTYVTRGLKCQHHNASSTIIGELLFNGNPVSHTKVERGQSRSQGVHIGFTNLGMVETFYLMREKPLPSVLLGVVAEYLG